MTPLSFLGLIKIRLHPSRSPSNLIERYPPLPLLSTGVSPVGSLSLNPEMRNTRHQIQHTLNMLYAECQFEPQLLPTLEQSHQFHEVAPSTVSYQPITLDCCGATGGCRG